MTLVRQELRLFRKQLRQELAKDAPNETMLDRLERAIALLAAEQRQLREVRKLLETQPEGEQWGPGPNAWWQSTLQRVQEELLAVRQSVMPLQMRQQKELLKDAPDETMLKDLEEAIAPLAATEQKLLDAWVMLESQPKGEQWGAAPDAKPTSCRAHPASWGQRTNCHLSSQAVVVAAVVHLLDLTAPAEARAMSAMGHLLAQTACIDLHAAHCALQKPIIAAAI